jgi:diaminohydroxyphosphoribosylaminopyrimidine deaminase/5-amino-6-(5-phosphoribosylamino)uracil reductase
VGLEAVPLSRGHVSLRSVLRRLAAMGMTNVLIEGGGHVLAAAFDAELIDEAYVFVAPKLIGGPHAPAALLRHRADGKLRDRPVRNPTTRWVGPDLLYHFTL